MNRGFPISTRLTAAQVAAGEGDDVAGGFIEVIDANAQPTGTLYTAGAAGAAPTPVGGSSGAAVAAGQVTQVSASNARVQFTQANLDAGGPMVHLNDGVTGLDLVAADWTADRFFHLVNVSASTTIPVTAGAGWVRSRTPKLDLAAAAGDLLVLAPGEWARVQMSNGFLNVEAGGGSTVRLAWEASKRYEKGDIVYAATAQGTIGVGDAILRNAAGTSAATFSAVEAAKWTEVSEDPDVVHLAGAQTIAGAKTFSVAPAVAADGTAANQLVRRSQFDMKTVVTAVGHPFMTGPTLNGFTVSTSSDYSATYAGWRAFQSGQVAADEWATNGQVTGWARIELPVAAVFNSVQLQGRAQSTERPTRWLIEASNDGTTFVTLLDNSAVDTLLNTLQTFTFPNTTPYLYYRFRFTAGTGGLNIGMHTIWFQYTGNDALYGGVPSTATLAVLGTKAPLASPTFTGTVGGVTKAMVGLGSADNTSDVNKPVSTATATALGLRELAANKNAVNGYAGLDGTGKVAAAQLPSYVDDVVEAANLAAFPAAGETGKIYVALDSSKAYRWSGSAYVEISASPGSTDAVTEGTTNLYFTAARAKTAAVTDAVADGVMDVAPSQNAVFDALAANVANESLVYLPKSALIVTPTVIHPENFTAPTKNGSAGTYTASASSEFSAVYAAWTVFDGSDTVEWATAGVTANFWLKIVLPAARIVTSVQLRGRNSGNEKLTNWRLEGSNDGTNWTSLLVSTTILGNTLQTFAVPNSTAYTQYRIFAVAAEGPNPGLSRMTLRADGYAFANAVV